MSRHRPNESGRLERLLGPGAPELTCDECFEALDLFVALELARRRDACPSPRLRAHLDGCPACEEEHDSLLALLGAQPQLSRTRRPGPGRAGAAARGRSGPFRGRER